MRSSKVKAKGSVSSSECGSRRASAALSMSNWSTSSVLLQQSPTSLVTSLGVVGVPGDDDGEDGLALIRARCAQVLTSTAPSSEEPWPVGDGGETGLAVASEWRSRSGSSKKGILF